jgi:hypothetical protein
MHQLADRESSVAALRASFVAHQPFAALACGISQRGIHNLDKFLIGR